MTDPGDDERIYAIGDIHGRSDLLAGVLDRVRADLARRPHARPRILCLGDYCDRGPDSRGVIEALLALERGEVATTFLLGNHDVMALAFLEDAYAPETERWLEPSLGGAETLRSYGVEAVDRERARTAFLRSLPGEHREFLERCRLSFRAGGYLFAHAGIRPGVALEAQDPDDLVWIREPFLSSTADHGAKVVHGHTIVPRVEHWPNRIAVDTGAVRTGVLSCVVIEGAAVGLLGPGGPEELPMTAFRRGAGWLWSRVRGLHSAPGRRM